MATSKSALVKYTRVVGHLLTGPLMGIIDDANEYHQERRLKLAEEILHELLTHLLAFKETEKSDVAEAYVRSEFTDPMVKELFDDLLVQLLNQPNKETLPHVVWLYSNYIYEKERPNTAAQRLVKMLLDCDISELELLKQFVEKMSEFRNPDAEQMIVKYNQEQPDENGTVYLSVSAAIPMQFDKNNTDNWKSWEVEDTGYWAVMELMKRHGVAREVPLNVVGGTAFTDDQILVSKEAVDLILKAFPSQ